MEKSNVVNESQTKNHVKNKIVIYKSQTYLKNSFKANEKMQSQQKSNIFEN